MKTKRIMVNTKEEIQSLVDKAGRVKGPVEIAAGENGNYDASSILGLFSVPLGSMMAVSYPDSADDFDDFLATLEFTVATQGY